MKTLILPLALAGLCAMPAAAQNLRLKPGLWELSSTMKSSSGQMEESMSQMQQMLEKMPPEQRKQMEQMMAQRGIGLAPDGGQTVRICMSPKDVELDQLPTEPGCTQKTSRLSANTIKVAYSCQARKDEPPSSGEGTVTVESPTAFSGQHRMNIATRGKPEQIDMRQKGRWLAADSDKLKPRRAEAANPAPASILGVCAVESPDFGEADQLVEILETVQLVLQ